jgi:hypothetical protein
MQNIMNVENPTTNAADLVCGELDWPGEMKSVLTVVTALV